MLEAKYDVGFKAYWVCPHCGKEEHSEEEYNDAIDQIDGTEMSCECGRNYVMVHNKGI